MFLRRKCKYKDGKAHFYWSLVETYRTSSGPRQRTAAYLGDMDEAGRLGVKDAAEGHGGEQTDVFHSAEPEWVEVNIRRVRAERCRRFGDVPLNYSKWVCGMAQGAHLDGTGDHEEAWLT